MALPKSSDTPRGRHLLALVKADSDIILEKWPWPDASDLNLFGAYINYYSLVDFALYRAIDILSRASMLSTKLSKAPSLLSIGAIQQKILGSRWGRANGANLEKLIEYRSTRNLLAHFVARKIPNEPAFAFMTRSMRDFKHEAAANLDPSLEKVMVFVVDAKEIVDRLKEVHALHNWLVGVTNKIEADHKAKPPSEKAKRPHTRGRSGN